MRRMEGAYVRVGQQGYEAVLRELRRKRLRLVSNLSEAEKSLSERFRQMQERGRGPISRSVLRAIQKVGSHEGATVTLKNAVSVPLRLRTARREKLRSAPDSDPYVRDAALTTMAYLGSAGFHALPEYFDGTPAYWAHVVGQEDDRQSYSSTQHRLSAEVSTLHPHKPFGPALFGNDRAQKLDAISPDIIAYIVADKVDSRTRIGPIIYVLEDILSNLDSEIVDLLKHKHFRIDPEVAVTGNNLMGFGGVAHINVIG